MRRYEPTPQEIETYATQARRIAVEQYNMFYGTTDNHKQENPAECDTVGLAPHDYRELVNDLRDVMTTYGKTQQLRTHIDKTLRAYNIKPRVIK